MLASIPVLSPVLKVQRLYLLLLVYTDKSASTSAERGICKYSLEKVKQSGGWQECLGINAQVCLSSPLILGRDWEKSLEHRESIVRSVWCNDFETDVRAYGSKQKIF